MSGQTMSNDIDIISVGAAGLTRRTAHFTLSEAHIVAGAAAGHLVAFAGGNTIDFFNGIAL
jgi:hypothetical protein